MKRVIKWTAIAIVTLGFLAFCAFLYLIPPFFLVSPDTFTDDLRKAAPLPEIADPRERALAERGRYIVMTTGCTGCHATNGAQGPDYSKYLAGGGLKFRTPHGTFVSRNLTSDPETGLPRRTDDDVKRVLRSGVFPDGHVVSATVMPWASFSHWSDEDRHAVVVYLRHLPAVRHQIPDPDFTPVPAEDDVLERAHGGLDYGVQ